MFRYIVRCALIVVVCCTARAEAGSHSDQTTKIYVASLGWHTGLVVPKALFPDSLWPGKQNFEEATYLEIGWGDRDYYQSRNLNPWYLLKASLWPTRTALHMSPAPDNIPEYYVAEEAVELTINKTEQAQLKQYLLEHIATDANGKLIPLGKGFYPGSHFFAGSSKYYLPKNSNVWAASALKHAGFSLVPAFLQTTSQVLNKAANYGEVIVEK